MSRKYAVLVNQVVSKVVVLDDAEVSDYVKNVEMLIDITDSNPEPTVGYILNGNILTIPVNASSREAFEIELNSKKSEFGSKLSKNAIDRIGARNKILNKDGAQVTTLLTNLIGVKSLMETGALDTARSACVNLKAFYTEYSDIFDYVINEINTFEISNGL